MPHRTSKSTWRAEKGTPGRDLAETPTNGSCGKMRGGKRRKREGEKGKRNNLISKMQPPAPSPFFPLLLQLKQSCPGNGALDQLLPRAKTMWYDDWQRNERHARADAIRG